MGRRSSAGSCSQHGPSAPCAGVLNDYIISSVCSTLLFYGGFSIAVKKGGEEREEGYKGSHLVPVCAHSLWGARGAPTAFLGAPPAADRPPAGSGFGGNQCPFCWFIFSISPPHPLAASHCVQPLGLGLVTETSPRPLWPGNGCGCRVALSWSLLPGPGLGGSVLGPGTLQGAPRRS